MPPVSAGRASRVAQLLGMAPSPPPPGRVRAMLAARRRMVDAPYTARYVGVDLPDGSWVPAGRAIAARPVARDGSGLDYADEAFLRQRAEAILTDRSNTLGFFDPEYNLVAYPSQGDKARKIRRHEVMHAYNAAAEDDTIRGLPFAARVTGALRDKGDWTTEGQIGRVLDELVAQRVGGARFGDIPWNRYGEQYKSEGAAVAAGLAYGLGGVQRAGQFVSDTAPYLAAGAVGTGILAYGLSQEEEDRAALEEVLRARRPGGMSLSAGGVMAGTNSLEDQ